MIHYLRNRRVRAAAPPRQPLTASRARATRPIKDRWLAIADGLPVVPQSALDFGAGIGELSVRLADTFGTNVVAIDRKGVGLTHRRVQWQAQRLSAAQLAACPRVEVAFALSVLHHLPDWAAAWWALNEIADWVVVEVPHPDEGTTTVRAGQLRWLHDLVAQPGAVLLGEYPGWKTSLPRPTYLVKSRRAAGISGTVKAGAGKTARQLPNVAGLPQVLNYDPFPGSLGMDLAEPFDASSRATITVPSRYGNYQFIPARLSGLRCHVMLPPRGKNWPGTAEVTAPVRLREVLALPDGAAVQLE